MERGVELKRVLQGTASHNHSAYMGLRLAGAMSWLVIPAYEPHNTTPRVLSVIIVESFLCNVCCRRLSAAGGGKIPARPCGDGCRRHRHQPLYRDVHRRLIAPQLTLEVTGNSSTYVLVIVMSRLWISNGNFWR